MKTLLTLVLLMATAVAQTATVGSHNTTVIPYDGQAAAVHLAWGPPAPTAGWTVLDYCVHRSEVAGQHPTDAKGCGTHVAGTTLDVYPFLGPGFYVVWAELRNADGTQIALSQNSSEASCDFEILSQTATLVTYYCRNQVIPPNPPTNGTVTVQ